MVLRSSRLPSLRRWFLTGLAALLVVLSIPSLYASFRTQEALDALSATADQAEGSSAIATLRDAVREWARSYTATDADSAGLARRVDTAFATALAHLSSERQPDTRALVLQAAGEWGAIEELAKPGGTADSASEKAAAMASVSAHLAELEVLLDRAGDLETARVTASLADIRRDITTSLAGLRVMLVCAAAATAIGLCAIVRMVLRPLEALRDGVQKFAGGDLAHRLRLESSQEFSRIARVFNAMAERLADQVSTLQNEALHDPLTGLYNRRELERRLHEELARARRYGRQFALLLIDVDHFKMVNDMYGHLAGDDVLVEIARRLENEVRIVDLVARFGGEEFAVVLSEATGQAALAVAERIRTVMHWPISGANLPSPVSTTVSIGIAEAPAHGLTAQELLAAADAALYRAKEAGRDTICVYVPPDEATGGKQSDSN